MFKFWDLLCDEDKEKIKSIYPTLEGSVIYIPKHGSDFIRRRNKVIKRYFERLKKTGLTSEAAYAEIQLRCNSAKRLSLRQIRRICHSFV